MKRILITSILLASALALGCNDKSATDDVREAREKTAEKQEDLEEAKRDVAEAQAELVRARGEFVVASNRRLDEIDARIIELRKETNSKIDWVEVDRLRAAADRLRSEVGNSARVYADSVKAEFDQLARDLDARLGN